MAFVYPPQRVPSPTEDPEKGGARTEGTAIHIQPLSSAGHATVRPPFPEYSLVWTQYLEDTVAQAQSNADTWQTAIDAHLLFAGLFAGVVASFVIDSRDDLLDDSQKVILVNIRDALLSEDSEGFRVDAITLTINMLWFVSMLLTLFGAVIGGMAKSWFLEAATASRGQSSNDVYKRWVLSLHHWRLRKLISAVPSALHLAAFLWAIGFGLQTQRDNPVLGGTIVAIVGCGTAIYFVMTVAPLRWQESAPFLRTPTSDFWSGVHIVFFRVPRVYRVTDPKFPDDTEGNHKDRALATILRVKFLSSAKKTHIDMGIMELVRIHDDEWLRYFVKHDVLDVCIKRLKECMNPKHSPHDQADAIGHHLKTLLYLLEWADRQKSRGDENFRRNLTLAIASGEILHRWNYIPDSTRPLALSLRAMIYPRAGMDLLEGETEEFPWESVIHHAMHPTQRLIFTMAACHTISQEPKTNFSRLRCVSAVCISLGMVNATRDTSIPVTTKWLAKNDHDKSASLSRGYLQRLFNELVSHWSNINQSSKRHPIRSRTRESFERPSEGQEIGDTAKISRVLDMILTMRPQPEPVSDDEIEMVSALLCSPFHADVDYAAFKQVVGNLPIQDIEDCLKHAITTGSADMLVDVLQMLPILLRLVPDEYKFVSDTVITVMIRNRDRRIRAAGRNVVKSCLNKFPEKQSELKDRVTKAVREFYEGSKKLDTSRFDTIEELWLHNNRGLVFVPEFLRVVLDIVLRYPDNERCQSTLSKTLIAASEEKEIVSLLNSQIRGVMPGGLGKLFSAKSHQLRLQWLPLLLRLAQGANSKPAFEQLIELGMTDAHSQVRLRAMDLLFAAVDHRGRSKFEHEAMQDAIESKLLGLVSLPLDLQGIDHAAVSTSLDMLTGLLRCHVAWNIFKTFVGATTLETLSALPEDDVISTESTTHFISQLPKHLNEIATSTNVDSRILFAKVLALLARDEDVFWIVCPHLLSIAFWDGDPRVRIAAISAIGRTLKGYKQELKLELPHGIRIASDKSAEVRKAWVETLKLLASSGHAGLDDLTLLVEIASKDEDDEVRSASIYALRHVAELNELAVEVIERALAGLPDLGLNDMSYKVRRAWADTFAIREHLIRFAKDDPSEPVRSKAWQRLAIYFKQDLDFQIPNFMESATYSLVRCALESPSFPDKRQAFRVLKVITTNPDSIEVTTQAIKPMVAHILQVASQHEDISLTQAAGEVFKDICSWQQPDINSTILDLLPNVVDLGSQGRSLIPSFLTELDLSKHQYTLSPADDAVSKLLKNGHWHSERMVIECLTKFHHKCATSPSYGDLMHDLIDEIETVALNHKGDRVREGCLRLLIQLHQCTNCRHWIKIDRERFMPFLDVKSLRPVAAELISLFCVKPMARRKVATWIVNRVSVVGASKNEVEAAAEMLLRLILDKRLAIKDQTDATHNPDSGIDPEEDNHSVATSDYALLLLGSVLIVRHAFTKYKLQFATALWRNYRHIAIQPPSSIPDSLVERFLYMVFGNHATTKEVEKWLGRRPVHGRSMSEANAMGGFVRLDSGGLVRRAGWARVRSWFYPGSYDPVYHNHS